MRVISDFDGVWTDPRPEAECVGSFATERLAEALSEPAPSVRSSLDRILERLRRDPGQYGWEVDGALTAYLDEDPFCVFGGIFGHLMTSDDPNDQPLRDAVMAAGGAAAFGTLCHHEGVARALATQKARIDPGARDAAQLLQRVAEEITIVSNSATPKLTQVFSTFDVHERTAPHDRFLFHGHARKYALTGPPQTVDFAGRAVRVDRGHYDAVLRSRLPNVVIGDVFSLDLALPLYLRRTNSLFRGLRAILLRRPYTPDWALAAVRTAEGGHVAESLSHACDLIATWSKEGHRTDD